MLDKLTPEELNSLFNKTVKELNAVMDEATQELSEEDCDTLHRMLSEQYRFWE